MFTFKLYEFYENNIFFNVSCIGNLINIGRQLSFFYLSSYCNIGLACYSKNSQLRFYKIVKSAQHYVYNYRKT